MPMNRVAFAADDRLKRLERRIRRLQVCLAALLVLWALTATIGIKAAAVPQALDAQQFRVLDASGQPQAVLRAGPGGAELVFFGPHGKQSMVISDKAQLVPLQ